MSSRAVHSCCGAHYGSSLTSCVRRHHMFYDQRQMKMRIESVRRRWYWSRSMRVRVQESAEVDRFRMDREGRRRTSAQRARAFMYNVARTDTLHDPYSRSRSVQPHLWVVCCTRGKHIKKSNIERSKVELGQQ